MEGIGESGTENRDVAEDKTFAVINGGCFRCIPWQERSARVAQVLQRSAPEQSVPPVGGETVIESRDDGVVVGLGGRSENRTRIIYPLSGGSTIGHCPPGADGSLEIT